MASGIILPGPCPLLEPSDELTKERQFDWRSIISTVPFAARNSFLFRDISLSNIPHCHSLSFSGWIFLLKYGGIHASNKCPFFLVQDLRQTADNVSYIFDSEVLPKRTSNCSLIQEQIRVWFVNEGVIIWSCEDVDSGNGHDEAVMVVVNSHIDDDDDEFGKKVNHVRSVIGVYLKGPLLERIVWPTDSGRRKCSSDLDCYTVNCMDVNKPQYLWIISATLFIALGFYIVYRTITLFWGCLLKQWNLCKNKNKIHNNQ